MRAFSDWFLFRTTTLEALVLALAAASPLLAASAPSAPGNSQDGAFEGRRVEGRIGSAILNVDTGETFPSIQDAVNDADTLNGHTLRVQVANHVEGQILIDKSLTLEGASGNEIVAMAVDTGNSGDNRAWLLVDTGIDLRVRDLIFDGNGNLVFQAFRHKGTGNFDRCTFRDINYNRSGPDYAGFAIVAFGGNVNIRDCVFENIGRVGVLAFGAGLTGSVLEGNRYTGKGVGDFLDYAYEASGGAVVILRDNQASGCRGIASVDGSVSSGMLASTLFGAGTDATIEENTLFDNSNGVFIGNDGDGSSAALRFNRIVGNDRGFITNSPNTIAENNWWGCNAGPNAAGCDAVSPNQTPDIDPWLILNLSAVPNTVPVTQSANLIADLTGNSDAMDTSGLGNLPDGIDIGFSTDLGSVAPPTAATVNGMAGSVFTAGIMTGTANTMAMLDNQSVTAPVQILPALDLQIVKEAAPNPVPIGGQLTYTLTLTNLGPSDATNVLIEDPLPNNVIFNSVIPMPECGFAAGMVTCNLPTLPANNSFVVTIVVEPTETGEISNTATARADETDLNPVNDSSTARVQVLLVVPTLSMGALIVMFLLLGACGIWIVRKNAKLI